MASHLSALVFLVGIPSLIGPLIVWAVKKDHHPFIAGHALEALNFNVSVLIYTLVGGLAGFILAILTLGLGLFVLVPLGIAAFIAWAVVTIIAGIKASNGESYRYPLSIRFIK